MSQVKLLLKRGQRTCCLCKFSFYGGHSLRRHLKGVHEVDVLLETDSKPRPHKCFHCEKAFIHSSGRRRHVRLAHKDLAVESSASAQVDLDWPSDCEPVPDEDGRFSCKSCQFLAETLEKLKMHYIECHHPALVSRERQITFDTYEDFMDFKEDLEYSQPSYFVKWRMVRQSTSDYVRFNCSRQARRIGILRTNRTDKMDAPCTAYFKEILFAFMEVMVKRGEVTCRICTARFINGLTMRRHLSVIHKVRVKLAELPRNHVCEQCSVKFTRRQHLLRHVRNVHKNILEEISLYGANNECASASVDVEYVDDGWLLESVKGKKNAFVCNLCDFSTCARDSLTSHYAELHPDLGVEAQSISFDTYEDFLDFKSEIEQEQPSLFTKYESKTSDTATYAYFKCSRQSHRSERTRTRRTHQIQGTCPAFMRARIDSEGVHVSYVKEHTHECDAAKLPLSENQRQLLTSWFRGGLTTNKILDNCKTRGERDRMFYLQRDEVNSMRRKYLKESQRLNNDTMEAVNELLVALDKRSSENPRSETLRKAKTQLEQVASKMSNQHDAFMAAKHRLSKTEFAIAYPGIRFRKTETEQQKSAQDGEAIDSPYLVPYVDNGTLVI